MRKKMKEQSKRDKAQQKARLAKNWKEQKKKLNEMPAGDEKRTIKRNIGATA